MNQRNFTSYKRTARSAFTLLEILIVLALVGLLAGIAVTNLDKVFGDSQADVAEMQVKQAFRAPLMQYKMHMGSFPSTEEGLDALVNAPEGKSDRWRGPYFDGGAVPDDPWGNPYQYRFPGEHNDDGYDLWSFGPDGTDSDQNIGNW